MRTHRIQSTLDLIAERLADSPGRGPSGRRSANFACIYWLCGAFDRRSLLPGEFGYGARHAYDAENDPDDKNDHLRWAVEGVRVNTAR